MVLTQPTHVRKRDGRLVAYDQEKLKRSLTRAAHGCYLEEGFYALEIAEAVSLHLAKEFTEISPTTEDIAEAIDIILQATSWAKIGDDYKNYRNARDSSQKNCKVVKPAQQSLFEADKTVLVSYNQEQRTSAWNRTLIVSALVNEASISKNIAKEIARAVEDKIILSGISLVTTTLIRAITDNELLQRGFSKLLSQRNSITIPLSDIEKSLKKGKAINLATLVGSESLPAFSLTRKYSNEIAMAHRRAVIDIAGLKHPYSRYSEIQKITNDFTLQRFQRQRNLNTFKRLDAHELEQVIFNIDKITPAHFKIIDEIIDYNCKLEGLSRIAFQFDASEIDATIDLLENIQPTSAIQILFWGAPIDALKLEQIIQRNWNIAWSPTKIAKEFGQLVSVNCPQAIYRSPEHNLDSFINELDQAIESAIQAIRQSNAYIYRNQKAIGMIDIIGLKETVQILTGSDIFEKDKNTACEDIILMYIKKKLERATLAYNINISLCIVPNMACGKRFAAIDQSLFPELFGYLDFDIDSIEGIIPPYSTIIYSANKRNDIASMKNKSYDCFDFIQIGQESFQTMADLVSQEIAFKADGQDTIIGDNSFDHPELPGLN